MYSSQVSGLVSRATLGRTFAIHKCLKLELAFAQKSLRDLCESQLKAERRLGIAVAAALRARLADLRDAESVDDVIAGPPLVLNDEPPGRIAVPLSATVSIVFSANHASVPFKDPKHVNWSRVTRIKIIEVGGSND
jgi:hypothetical protein